MALKSTYTSEEKGAEIEEALDALDALVDRVKVLYEQYFMGIQRQPPTHLHTTLERQLRDLQQQQIRNTALRYRFVTLQQKHGSYNSYWKRTLREIEAGRYLRNLSRLRAKAAKTGDAIPEEILAKMPKRMRDAIAHDRELALAKAAREGRLTAEAAAAAPDAPTDAPRARRDSAPAMVVSAAPTRAELAELEDDALTPPVGSVPPVPPTPRLGVAAVSMAGRDDRHFLDDVLGDDDIDAALAALADEAAVTVDRRRRPSTDPPPFGLRPPAPASQPALPALGAVAPPARAWPAAAVSTAGMPSLSTSMSTSPGSPTASSSTDESPPVASPKVPQPIKVIPPIQILPAGLRTPPTGVPIRAATPPVGVPLRSATPPTGLPLRSATPPVGVPLRPPSAGLPPIPRVSAPHASSPMSGAHVAPVAAPPPVSAAPPAPPPVSAAPSPVSAPTAIPPIAPPHVTQPIGSPLARPPVSRPPLARPAAAPASSSSPSGIPGMTESDTRALYTKYVKARTLVGDATEPMTYERMVKTLSSQAPKILRDHHSTGVEFNVVVRDNKVVLKAKPK